MLSASQLPVTELLPNADRLQQTLQDLAAIGALPNGGVCRLAFSDADLSARNQVQDWMEATGMTTRIDAAGNLIGRYAGREDLPALVTGSHLDTVPVGGRYDGALGVVAGLEVVRTLAEQGLRLRHPLEVIAFMDEERSVIGSKAIAGQVRPDPSYYRCLDGSAIEPCLQKMGGNWDQIASARRTDIAAFLELHVEQGGVLEHQGCAIGIVTGIVGQYRFAVEILGQMNHAGTTPMGLRKDALIAAAQIVLAVQQLALTAPGDPVATVGHLTIQPNATNAVPGRVDLHIDLRDLSQPVLDDLVRQIRAELAAIAQRTDTTITLRETLHILPTLADGQVQTAIGQACQTLGLSAMPLPSRAGHDAQEIGRIAPMGMIFVPSRGGISHSHEEFTSPEECWQGVAVLLATILALDHSLPS